MHLGELSGWTSVVLGQLVSWPQVLKLRRERGDGVSLASYAIVLVSMSLFLVHAVAIGDLVSTVSVPLSLIPNVLIAATLVRRRCRLSADDVDGDVDPLELGPSSVGGDRDAAHPLRQRQARAIAQREPRRARYLPEVRRRPGVAHVERMDPNAQRLEVDLETFGVDTVLFGFLEDFGDVHAGHLRIVQG
jgi:uncharacterized protein with PQ loop repeat